MGMIFNAAAWILACFFGYKLITDMVKTNNQNKIVEK